MPVSEEKLLLMRLRGLTIHPDSLLWIAEDDGLVEHPGVSRGAQTRAQADAFHGIGGDLPKTKDQFARANGAKVPVLVARSKH